MKTYTGHFNWHGEDHTLYTSATSKTKAFHNLCSQLGKKVEYNRSAVANYFLGTDKYRIELTKNTINTTDKNEV